MKNCKCKNTNCGCDDGLLKLMAIDIQQLKNAVEELETENRNLYWNNIQDKPSLFPPSLHNHLIEDVEGLGEILDNKAEQDFLVSNYYDKITVDNKVLQVVSETIPISGTVLPQGANIPTWVLTNGKAELKGATGGTTYTQVGGPSTTVSEGYVRDAFYNKSTDLWTFSVDQYPLPTSPLVDNLNSTSTTIGLTGNQGRLLNDKIAVLRQDISETIAKVFTTTLPVVRFSSQVDLTTPDTNQTIIDTNTLRVIRANSGGANTVMYANTGVVLNQASKKVSVRFKINSEIVSGSGVLFGYGTIDNIPTSVPHGIVWRNNGQLFFVDPYSANISLPTQDTYTNGDIVGFDYEVILNGSTIVGGRFRIVKNNIYSNWFDDNTTFRGNLLIGFRGGFSYDLTIGTENSNSLLAQSKLYTDNKILDNSQKVTYLVDASVATSGNGSFSAPFKTISEAINAIGSKKNVSIQVKTGIYRESINLSDKTELNIEISNYYNSSPKIFGSETIVGWTKTPGYNNIYQVSYSNTIPVQVRDGRRLFEHGRLSKPISVNDRHPLQKGLSHRLPYTEINETTDTGSLTDILNSLDTKPSTFYTVGGILYIHLTGGANPNTTGYTIENQVRSVLIPPAQIRNVNIDLNCIGSYYSSNYGFDFLGFNLVNRKFVVAIGSRNNGFSDDIGNTYSLCDEAGGTGNDGIGGHMDRRGSYDSLEIRFSSSKNCYIDPWVHDCRDDGISLHKYSFFIGYGGLFEYNGKAGLIPANGSLCYWKGGLSRYNVVAGLYVGNAVDPVRPWASAYIEDFICDGNYTNYRVSDDINWTLELKNCDSRNATGVGYRCSMGKIKALGCTTFNDALSKLTENGGTIEIVNQGTLLS